MTNGIVSERSWPPQCCVPAFVTAALEVLGYPIGDPATLPRLLGVKVDAADANPLHLPIAQAGHELGVTTERASSRIKEVLAALGAPVRFIHMPINRIPRDALPEFVEDALARGAVLGVGVQHVHIDEAAPQSARHVLRIEALSNGKALLIDDSGEGTQRRTRLDFDQIVRAAHAANDGFWIFESHTGAANGRS